MTINAGALPSQHWTQVQKLEGAVIIGEGCHFIDLARFLIGEKIISIDAKALNGSDIGLPIKTQHLLV